MSFLSGIFLLALPLAAIPVVLHLYRRRQRTVVPWGAMRFLQDATKQGQRSERWEELLLMLLRAAAVVALVLALSRPQLSGRWFGDAPAREVILVIDDSMSMTREIGGETPVSALKEQAKTILDELTSSDAVQVMTAVGGPRWLTAEAIRADAGSKATMLSQITSLPPTEGAADWLSCVQAALTVEPSSDAQARHIVLLTDGQAHGWRLDSLASWRRLQQLIQDSSLPTTLKAVSCGMDDASLENVAIKAITASHTQMGVGDQVTIRVDVQNVGTQPAVATTLESFVNGRQESTVDVPSLRAGETASLEWKWRSDKSGVYALSSRLQSPDQLLRDNENAVIVEVVGEIPVLIVDAPYEYRQRMSAPDFLCAALGYESGAPLEGWHSVFTPRTVSVDEFGSTSLSDYRAIILTDVEPGLTPHLERLREFVERGGGLWIILGRGADREAFNSTWYDDGGGLCPLALDALVSHTGDERQEAVIHPPSSDHPATGQLADTRRLDIDSVRIMRRHKFRPPAHGQELSVLLETGDGEPLVIEQYVGRGRVIVQALPFDVGWSNLPLTKAHVVMVQEWLEYLSQPAATQFNLPAGGRIELVRPAAAALHPASITLPDGTQHGLTLRSLGDSAVCRYSQTQVPGRYEVQWGDEKDGAVLPFQVARDAGESDLQPLTLEQEESLTQAASLEFPPSSTELIPHVSSGVRDRPIWNSLLAALLILLGLELLLAMRAARRRTPAANLTPSLEGGNGYLPSASAAVGQGSH